MAERRSRRVVDPGHRVELEPSSRRVRVRVGGVVIADSERTLIVRETGHAPVVYFPRADVRTDLLEATERSTSCPFKGDASYWTIRAGDHVEENAVWAYEDPFPELSGLAAFLAFYPDRVEWEFAD
jgi:uncharacterized protein (DUF427 family)